MQTKLWDDTCNHKILQYNTSNPVLNGLINILELSCFSYLSCKLEFVYQLLNVPAAIVSQGWNCSDKWMCCHIDIEVADQTFYLTKSQYIDTGQLVSALTLYHQLSGRVATGVPIFKSLVWLNPERPRRKRELNLGSAALEADALTTLPTRQCKQKNRDASRQRRPSLNCLAGLVIRRSPRKQQTWVQFPLSLWVFFRSSHTCDLQIGNQVVTLSDAWHDSVSTGLVSGHWLGDIASLTYNFFLNVAAAACTNVWANPSLRCARMLLEC